LFIDHVLNQLSSSDKLASFKNIADEILGTNPNIEMVSVSRDEATPITSIENLNTIIAELVDELSPIQCGYTLAINRTAGSWDSMSFKEKAAAIRKITKRRHGRI
jgi:hypothetical protein